MREVGLEEVEQHRIKNDLPLLSEKAKKRQTALVCDYASTLITFLSTIGSTTGMIVGGYLKNAYGFRDTCDIMTAMSILTLVLWTIMVPIVSCFKSKST